jgi:GT2 family glycosyltransferase
MDSIPVIGTAIVNTPFWVNRLIMSVDYPVDEFVIFDNSNNCNVAEELDNIVKIPHKFIKKIKVCHLPNNIGCPGAWNLIIKSYLMAPYWIITNHDIAFTPGVLQKMVEQAQTDVDMVFCNKGDHGHGSFEFFLIKDIAIKKYGLFDENFYPAYVEDYDYIMRLILSPSFKCSSVELPFHHGENTYGQTGSQTWRSDLNLKTKIDHSRILNESVYMKEKWGPHWHNFQPYKTPFNNENLSLSYTTYDLDFLRQKYLGF